MKMTYLDKPYQVTMSVQQMAVLLCFNEQDMVTVVDLQTETQLTTDVLVKVLRSLVDASILKNLDQVRTSSTDF